jgi:Holliday junction resolvase RusA-like endonuclease
VARDFTPTKTGRHGSMNIQKSEEFQTSKFYCKTNFDMAEIKAEEEDYANYPLPIAYDFKSIDARERILYRNYNSVKKDVDDLIKAVQTEFKK